MEHEIFKAGAYTAKVYRCNTAVVGSGAAGFNAADRLWQLGQHDIVLVTENRVGGTSRNTGSDKQTYYKLTLSGGDPDSVREMADTLFAGRCVDGDIALCEAALSTQCFLKLVELGVPFPRNRYGEYIGYKTDHDPRRRATSVGPYTSKQMTECLEAAVQAKGVPMLDKTQVIKILADGGTVCGLLCLNTAAQNDADRFTLIRCKNVIWATGGPAGMYADSVYPFSQYGALADNWKESYNAIKAYLDEHGKLPLKKASITLPTGSQSHWWIRNQTLMLHQGRQSEDKVKLLNEIGIV